MTVKDHVIDNTRMDSGVERGHVDPCPSPKFGGYKELTLTAQQPVEMMVGGGELHLALVLVHKICLRKAPTSCQPLFGGGLSLPDSGGRAVKN